MEDARRSVLLLGESNVGKTHYGAQVLKRLVVGSSSLRMHGQATNLTPFEDAMERLSNGRAIGHTPSELYVESVWPVIDHQNGRRADLVWPDYGGEQIKAIIADHRISAPWRDRVAQATDWVLLIRLHTLRNADDIFSRPLAALRQPAQVPERRLSDQARLVELLQMLLHLSPASRDSPAAEPTLTILLSCWDEVMAEARPSDALRASLPMLADFVESAWRSPTVLGLSALGRPLSESSTDPEFATKGPESFGFVVQRDGALDTDITFPITRLICGVRDAA